MTGYLLEHNTNGNVGRGTRAFADKAFADKYAKLMNQKYPETHHYIVNAPEGTPLQDIKDYSLEHLTKVN